MNPTPARQLLAQVVDGASAALLTTALNTFLAGLGEATVVSVQLSVGASYSALVLYSK